MTQRDYKDIIGGVLLMILGAFASLYAHSHLQVGTVINMGPGMFPMALGVILIGFGLSIFGPAWFRGGEQLRVHLQPLAMVLLSLLAFALIIRPFGMVTAIIVLTLIASRADNRLGIKGVLLLAASLSVFASLAFKIGLGIPVQLLAWPW